MKSISLAGSDWTLTCYWQHQWRMRHEGLQAFLSALPPVPSVVPGAVHADLLKAGVIEDWQNGLNAQKCEWINNRDWSFRRRVNVPGDFNGTLTLECDGLDYSGHVLINGKPIATFEGTHLRHEFDLTGRVAPGDTFDLEFIFDASPQIDGVFGFTSRNRVFKPRFGYYWDWCTRVVNVGIWQDIRLVCRGGNRFGELRVLPRVQDNLASGHVRIVGTFIGPAAVLQCVLRDDNGTMVSSLRQAIDGPSLDVTISVEQIRLWWPAMHGEQPLYRLDIELLDAQGNISDSVHRTVGFKRIRWLQNPGAPADARPYLCDINGRPIFLRGVNWVPMSPLYGTVTPERYEVILRLYRNMNANVLRVWGGGILEAPAFYELCDRLGLLVWQEFPLSSSGIDNWPPEEPDVIEHLQRIAAEFIERRGHHACHLLWCGGNELQGALDGGKVGIGKPVDESHPLMQKWGLLVERLDPGKRFLTSSPSGPRFHAERRNFGKGIHHQTHGPWGNVPLADRYAYFNGDDSLFRSETGAPGCSSLEALQKHCGDQSLWPPKASNPHWLVPAAAWVPWNDIEREFGPITEDPGQLPVIVKASRYLQGESYRYAIEAARRRHPACSGFIVWMGHDCVHCTANNSLIQIDASTKPAYDWVQRAFARRHVSLKTDSIAFAPGQRFCGEVWIHEDLSGGDMPGCNRGRLAVALRRLNGEIVESLDIAVVGEGESVSAATLDWAVPTCPDRMFVIDLAWTAGEAVARNRYLMSQQIEAPLAPLLSLPEAELLAVAEPPDGQGLDASRVTRIAVRNVGDTVAIGVRLVSRTEEWAIAADAGNLILFPDESQTFTAGVLAVARGVQWNAAACVVVECFNAAGPFSLSTIGDGTLSG